MGRLALVGASILAIGLLGGQPAAASSIPGQVVVWGGEDYSANLQPPRSAQSDVTQVSVGWGHVLARKSDGTVVAWGDNSRGQTEVPSAARAGVEAVAAGPDWSMAIVAGGRVVAWGEGRDGELNLPPQTQAGIVSVAAGMSHGLALSSTGFVFGWGATGPFDNDRGQADVPAGIQGNVKAIAAGVWTSAAVLRDGRVVVWGRADEVPPQAQSNVTQIGISGRDEFIALTSNGSALVWKDDRYEGITVLPTPSIASSGLTKISAGSEHFLGLKSDGSVVAWGEQYDEFRGGSYRFDSWEAIDVSTDAASGVTDISAGDETSAAVVGQKTPSSPIIIAVEPGDSQAKVRWDAPGYSGTSPITNYVVTASPGGGTCSAVSVECTILGLTNGQQYTFRIVAYNLSGESLPSTTFGPVKIGQANVRPGPPTGITATVKGRNILINWNVSPPAAGVTTYQWRTSLNRGKYTPWMETGSGSTPRLVLQKNKSKGLWRVQVRAVAPGGFSLPATVAYRS